MENNEVNVNTSTSTTSLTQRASTSQLEASQQESTNNNNGSSLNRNQLKIPQFVLLQEPITNTFQHPQVLFNFEGETVPDSISKEDCIIIDFNENFSEILDTRNYSPYFYLHNVKLVGNHPFTPTSGGGGSGSGNNSSLNTGGGGVSISNKEDNNEDSSNNSNEDTTLLIEGVFSKNTQRQNTKNNENFASLLENDNISNAQLINELEREFIISYEQFNQYLNR